MEETRGKQLDLDELEAFLAGDNFPNSRISDLH